MAIAYPPPSNDTYAQLRYAFRKGGLPPMQITKDVMRDLLDIRFESAPDAPYEYRMSILDTDVSAGTALVRGGDDFLGEQVFLYMLHTTLAYSSRPPNRLQVALSDGYLQLTLHTRLDIGTGNLEVGLGMLKKQHEEETGMYGNN